MASSSYSSDEDFLESLGVSLDEIRVIADVDTHASVTGVYAQTWAFEYFPYIRPELTHTDLGLGLVPLAWRWYRANHWSVLRRKSLGDLRTFFDTCTMDQGPSRAGPSHSIGAFRVPRAILEATGPVHPGLANLHLPYSIPYYTPDGTSSLREVSLGNVNRLALPPDDITEVPIGLVSQMMELVLGMQEELTSAWTLQAFNDQRSRRPRH
ncbi:hypothetical protein JCGZ_01791 [Jatropha curcas]|uniref:Aminotransferase-like plant mobile domain-containing protein n=1 Tax=Jatropha curcas TaxID=180498 RepID=A0A067L276_JATCU|nr:hypothetical protein JCGZ_01791 [Jatropha curcas]